MSSLLYYSISSDLTKDEIIEINKQVDNNRKAVYLFLTQLPSNSTRKAKRLFVYVMFTFQLDQPLVPCATAVMMGLPPAIHRLSPMNYEQERILSNKNYSPQIASIIESKMDKMVLTDQQIEDFNLICYKLQTGSITLDTAVLKLRAGGFSDWATLAFIIYMFSLQQGNSFQHVPLPHMNPVGWLNGRYDRKPMQHTSYKSSKFQLEMAGVTDEMCPDPEMADENGYVMSYEEARNLVAETSPGYMQVDENCKITDWQAAKHIYHSSGMGVDISKYGFTQQELNKIRGESRYKGSGLIAYARRGYRLPPIEMVEDYQLRLKTSCENAPIKKTNVPYYDVNGAWQARVFATPESEDSSPIIIAFNESTGDLITGDKQRPASFKRFQSENYLGAKAWMLKWRGK